MEVSEDWKASNVFPVFRNDKNEDLGNYRPPNLTSLPVKVTEQVFQKTVSKQVKDKKSDLE